jgi:hypothetical protein
VPLGLGLLDHGRVHLGVLVGLAGHRGPEVLERRADSAHVPEVRVGVDGLGVGGGAEQSRDLAEALLLGGLGEGEVLPVGLALAGERDGEVLLGGGHAATSTVPGRGRP